MKVAIISDIHGNYISLEQVLREIEREQPDGVVCLGDIAMDGPEPREVADRVLSLACPVVRGNCDDRVLQAPGLAPRDTDPVFEVVAWTHGQLSNEHLQLCVTGWWRLGVGECRWNCVEPWLTSSL